MSFGNHVKVFSLWLFVNFCAATQPLLHPLPEDAETSLLPTWHEVPRPLPRPLLPLPRPAAGQMLEHVNRLQDFDHKTIELRLLLGLADSKVPGL